MAENEVDTPPKYVMFKMADRPAYMIGRMMEESRDEVVLHYPAIITVYNDEEGMSVVTSKYMPFALDDLVSIVKTSIHGIASPKPRFVKHYLDFVKRWREGGLERILEARMVGDPDPATEEEATQTLSPEPFREGDVIH